MNEPSLAPAWFDILLTELNGEKKDLVNPSKESVETHGETKDNP